MEVKHPCPMHPQEAASLSIRRNEVTGSLQFTCDNPACRFDGTTLDLVASAQKLDHYRAALEFTRYGKFAHTLEVPLTGADALRLGQEAARRRKALAWTELCAESLRAQSETLLTGFRLPRRVEQLPPELGLVTKSPSLPASMDKWAGEALTYPFTFDGELRHTAIRNRYCTQPWDDDLVTVSHATGVFMEKNIYGANADSMLITFWPHMAADLATRISAVTSKRPAIAAVSGFPLPHAYTELKHLVLVSTPDCPLTPKHAADTYIYSRSRTGLPSIWVRVVERPVPEISAEDVIRSFTPERRGRALEQFIIAEVERILSSGGVQEKLDLAKAWDMVQATDTVLTRLVKAATEARLRLAMRFFEGLKGRNSNLLRLGNGNWVRSDTRGIVGIRDDDQDEVLLSNTGIRVEYKERAETGLMYVCTAYTDGSKAPVSFRVLDTDLRKGTGLEKAILDAYAERGESPYVAIYSVSGFAWPDVMLRLAADRDVRTQIAGLGAAADGTVRFPDLSLSPATGAVESETVDVPACVRTLYDGALLHGSDTAPLYAKLLSATGNPYLSGLALAMSHIVSQQAQALYYAAKNKPFVPKHLLFVETEPGVWHDLIRQLTLMLSDSEFPVALGQANPDTELAQYAGLGSLPLVLRLPQLRGDKLSRLLQESPVGIIASVDCMTAASGSSSRCAYVVPPLDLGHATSYLDEHDLEQLQHGFMHFLARGIRAIDTSMAARASRTPVLDAYRSLCQELSVAAAEDTEAMCSAAYAGPTDKGVDGFFLALYRMLYVEQTLKGVLQVANLSSQRWKSAHIAIGESSVLLRKGLPDLVSTYSTLGRYTVAALDAELEDKGMLTEPEPEMGKLDMSRCWVIKKEAWDRYVTTPSYFAASKAADVKPVRLIAG